ncbi:MAG TPA: isoaspartyl peptidase/L-asparaginase, partial [Bacteroidia bacterium]|nr:isoaspartyl peptidase/L-asparaginase [Bacteroidia bacterium]
MNRKSFLHNSFLAAIAAGLGFKSLDGKNTFPISNYGKTKGKRNPNSVKGMPVVISTWKHGLPANDAAMAALNSGGSALDAVEKGVWVVEADLSNTSVGLGGYPNRDGIVTLDACIMRDDGMCGSVSFVQGIEHPITLARKVMEKTPHVMLVGSGAELFAKQEGIPKLPNKLTEKTEKAWQKWLLEKNYKPVINIENHDTIGLL